MSTVDRATDTVEKYGTPTAGSSGATGATGAAGASGGLFPTGGASTQWKSASTVTRAYPLGPISAAAAAASIAIAGVGVMQAWPFTLASDATLYQLKVRSLGTANARVRFGIAESAGAPTYSITTVLVDSGDLDAATSAVTASAATLNVFLRAGRVYWAMLEPGTAAANFWGFPVACFGASNVMGQEDSNLAGAHAVGVRISRAYGAFPTSFSTYTSTIEQGNLPGVFGIFSSVG